MITRYRLPSEHLGQFDPLTLTTIASTAFSAGSSIFGGIFGMSQREKEIGSAKKEAKLREIALEKKRKELLEQAADAQRSQSAIEFAQRKRKEQLLVISAVTGIGVLIGGFFLFEAMKKKKRR